MSPGAEQWVGAVKSAGMRGLILTCKHHDGFCLWDTKTTPHNVMNSPYGAETDCLRIRVTDSRTEPTVSFIGLYRDAARE